MSKGNNLQSLFCGILLCISVTALIIACLAFTKKGGGKGEYYGGVKCGIKSNVSLCWNSGGKQGFIIEGGECFVPNPKELKPFMSFCKDDCLGWKPPAPGPNPVQPPPWAECIPMRPPPAPP